MEKYYKIEKTRDIDSNYLEELQISSSYSRIWKATEINRFLMNENNFSISCSLNTGIIGFCMCQNILDSLEICLLLVKKEYRSRGFAKLIFEEIIRFCKDKKIKRIMLEVSTENKIALNFYKSLNFKKVGTRKNYYSNKFSFCDAILMDFKL